MSDYLNREQLILNDKIDTSLKKSDFFYELPPELIAQVPSKERDMSRLMTVDRKTGAVGDHIFHDIADMLKPGDILVINDSKVIPARLHGIKKETGAVMEMLMLASAETISGRFLFTLADVQKLEQLLLSETVF